jgi:hypothetical protein
LVYLSTNGALNEWDLGYWNTTLASSGVASYLVGNGGQTIYWLTTGGVLNDCVNAGTGAPPSSAFGPGGTGIFGGVESIALADNGEALVYLSTNGALNEWDLGYWNTTLASSGVQSFAISRNGIAFQLNPATLGAEPGQSYNASVSVPGVSVQFSYTLASGSLPTGLSLSSAGVLSGTPTVSGTYTFTVQATSISLPGVIGTKACTLTVFAKLGATYPYSPVNGSLFGPNGPSYLDVAQGAEGDCWLMASLAEVAARAPSDIENMFTYDGTATENGISVRIYSVRFFNNNGVAEYVTVDTELPFITNPNGTVTYQYDNPVNGVLWAALAEKAYVEANGAGFVTSLHVGTDSYDALGNQSSYLGLFTGGLPSWALQAITGQPASTNPINVANTIIDVLLGLPILSVNFDIAGAWNAGDFIVLCSSPLPTSSEIVGEHCYAVVGYNASSSEPIEVYNPWGITDSAKANVYGLFNANQSFLWSNFVGSGLGSAAMTETTDHGNGSQQMAFLLQTAPQSSGSQQSPVDANVQMISMDLAVAPYRAEAGTYGSETAVKTADLFSLERSNLDDPLFEASQLGRELLTTAS